MTDSQLSLFDLPDGSPPRKRRAGARPGPGRQKQSHPQSASTEQRNPQPSRSVNDQQGSLLGALRDQVEAWYADHPDDRALFAARLAIDEAASIIIYAQIRAQIVRQWPSFVLADIAFTGADRDFRRLAYAELDRRELELGGGSW